VMVFSFSSIFIWLVTFMQSQQPITL